MSFVSVKNLSKTYSNGFEALNNINLDIEKGEILALLGPNGAGKTTLISIICGIVKIGSGKIEVDGLDIQKKDRKVRSMIGLVPQELATDAFETVFATVSFSRGLFGLAPDHQYIEKLLAALSLHDKKDQKIMTLSGGMKRRVMIAKALSHEPSVLFLDEPSAGVDVELRKDMWSFIRELRNNGTTIILTTHYLEEAEEMADRIGVINKGQLMLVEKTSDLMLKLGKKQLILDLRSPVKSLPDSLKQYNLELPMPEKLIYTYDTHTKHTGITDLLEDLRQAGIKFSDLHTEQSSLEDVFVELVKEK